MACESVGGPIGNPACEREPTEGEPLESADFVCERARSAVALCRPGAGARRSFEQRVDEIARRRVSKDQDGSALDASHTAAGAMTRGRCLSGLHAGIGDRATGNILLKSC